MYWKERVWVGRRREIEVVDGWEYFLYRIGESEAEILGLAWR